MSVHAGMYTNDHNLILMQTQTSQDDLGSIRDADIDDQRPAFASGITHLALKEAATRKSDDYEPTPHAGIRIDPNAIELGSTIPDSTVCTDSSDQLTLMRLWSSGDPGMEGSRWRLIFTVVNAEDTSEGCITQASGFKRHADEFLALGCSVACLTVTEVATVRRWKEKFLFPFEIFSDPSRTCLKLLGSSVVLEKWSTPPSTIARSYCIFECGTGNLIRRVIGVRPEYCAQLALQDLRALCNDQVEDWEKPTGSIP